ncbi:MAG TPA: mannitol dehydrogenase family protein [Rhizomicrobium sp.]|nr:mannitol dehydrogenase family protein [Rhizomicrobium sp.]
MSALNAAALARLPASVACPAFDPARLACGMVHLGIGAFHRAHQAVFTEDAIAAKAGNWGIIGASLKHPAVPDALASQDNLYTVESLGTAARYRVMGVIRGALFAPRDRAALLAALTAPSTHAVTLTLSEKGYCLAGDGSLDLMHPDIAADLGRPAEPGSAIGWLALALQERRKTGAGPLTILSCDNLKSNGQKLEAAVTAFAQRCWPGLTSWIKANTAFPATLVDCIVPASDGAHRARVAAALGFSDQASVQRETFAQWVIEDRFAGPLPAWSAAGAEIVADISGHERLKLHVLNGTHSALAYLGLPRGHQFVRQAIADRALRAFLEEMVAREIAPALAPLDAAAYWRTVTARFENPMIDHRLAQIAEDGSLKLPQRLFPLLEANIKAGRQISHLAGVIAAWLELMATRPSRDPANDWFAAWAKSGADKATALDDPTLFPDIFRSDAKSRAAILAAKV